MITAGMRLPHLLCTTFTALALASELFAQAKPLPSYTDAQAGEHADEDAAVTGKVFGISKTKTNTTFINLGAAFPNHTFTGVVFAGDAEKVGDLEQYNGKTVTITGRIAMSPQGKPQIVIKTADQIRSTEGGAPPAPSAPAPAPMPTTTTAPAPKTPPATTTTPTPAPAPSAAAPVGDSRKISLAANWNSPVQGGAMTRKDLTLLFAGQGSSSEGEANDASIILYAGIPYLTPLADARKRLNLENTSSSKSRVTCPGLPVSSFTAHLFNGVFEGGFNRLILVTDNADQLVSVLALDENSRQRTPNETDATGYHTYNFIQHRVKGTGDLVIKHEIAPGKGRVVVVDTMLIDPHDAVTPAPRSSNSRSNTTTRSSISKTGKVLERSRWFVPAPVVSLILKCAGSNR